ncbi:MAG: UDP-N-acetylmuramate dehydrogenase [Phycisphaerae bacterium]|jgi:UDP-N-acetylmuramate dehydrogenase|nr:UDP-N-acetylmuramate dehydrogenase [Phycisphaerae bacterium]
MSAFTVTTSSRPSSLFADLDVDVRTDAPLGSLTWYGIGGPADFLVRPRTLEALTSLVRRARRENIPVRVLGSGANLLVADEGVDGIVLKLDAPCFTELRYNASGATEAMRVGAGADLAKTLNDTVRRGLGGLAQMAGIPASVGGAIRMNAGGAYGAIGDAVHSVGCLSEGGEVRVYPASEILFGYRETNLRDPIILWAAFRLEETDPIALRDRVKEIFAYKKSTQPLADHSAGCMFKNPTDPRTGDRVSAGKLIDLAGLKGSTVGGAYVSPQHGNFIAVKSGARAHDIVELVRHIKRVVLEKHGVELVTEVVHWSRTPEPAFEGAAAGNAKSKE